MRARGMLLLLLLLPWSAQAKIFLAWEHPRDYTPPATFFDLVLEGPLTSGSPSLTRTMRVPATAPWACTFLPDDVEDTFCAELACPGPGIFQVTAYAIWPETKEKSGPSNVLTMQVVTAPVCAALRVTLPPPQPPSGPPPTPCNSVAYQPQQLPMPTTTTIPEAITLTAEPKTPTTTPPPLPARPQVPAPVRTGARVIVPWVAPKPVHRVGEPTPAPSATVYAGPPVEVPVQQPQVTLPPLRPCP
jgi:hypothetical protein